MTSQKWSKKEFWLCGLLMTISMLLFSSLYLLNVYPFTEGWGIYYAELISRGQIPYRDFYYYLPPLNLLIDWLFWMLSFGNLLVFRAWYMVQRLVIMWMLYKLLTKWFAPRFAWIACLTGGILRTAVVWDLGGDYNQTQTLLAMCLIYVVVWFLEKDADLKTKGISRYKYIILAGTIIAAMVLLKQSTGLAALIACFVFLIIYCIAFQDKRFVPYCLATAAGAVIPLGVFVVFLVANGALIPFLEQFFGVATAKGGVGTILFAGWRVVLTNWNYMLLYAAFVLVVYCAFCTSRGKTHPTVFAGSLILFALACAVCSSGSLAALDAYIDSCTTFLAALVMLAIFFVAYVGFVDSKTGKRMKLDGKYGHVWFMVILFAVVFAALRLNINEITISLFNSTTLFTDIPAFCTYFSIFTSLLGIVLQFVHYMRHRELLYPKAMTFLFVGGLADAYANMMNSSSDVYPIAAFINAAVLIAILFSLDMRKWTGIKNLIICVLCVVVCGSVMIQKYTTAYSWWGSETTYSFDQRTESVDIEAMAGLKLAPQRKLEFEQVTKLIEENDQEDSTVWGFPHVKIFNILTDHYNTEDPVPVLFYDVCSDAAALQELEWLQENYPDFVIWCDMPWCLEVHEATFRGGESLGQREIVNWFSEVKDTAYVKIGQVGNLFVYKLDDGSPINYTYFQDPYAVNSTAGEYLQET